MQLRMWWLETATSMPVKLASPNRLDWNVADAGTLGGGRSYFPSPDSAACVRECSDGLILRSPRQLGIVRFPRI